MGGVSRIAVVGVDFSRGRQASLCTERHLWLHPRHGAWDNRHVSTGPIVPYKDNYLMFYNGQSSARVWAIGEVVFERATLNVLSRAEIPIITPDSKEIGWRKQKIAFSSGTVMARPSTSTTTSTTKGSGWRPGTSICRNTRSFTGIPLSSGMPVFLMVY